MQPPRQVLPSVERVTELDQKKEVLNIEVFCKECRCT